MLLTNDMAKLKEPIFKYLFEIHADHDQLKSRFRKSAAPDKVLLPMTISLFFQYIAERIDKDALVELSRGVQKLLAYYKTHNCREGESLFNLPAKIINSLYLPPYGFDSVKP